MALESSHSHPSSLRQSSAAFARNSRERVRGTRQAFGGAADVAETAAADKVGAADRIRGIAALDARGNHAAPIRNRGAVIVRLAVGRVDRLSGLEENGHHGVHLAVLRPRTGFAAVAGAARAGARETVPAAAPLV